MSCSQLASTDTTEAHGDDDVTDTGTAVTTTVKPQKMTDEEAKNFAKLAQKAQGGDAKAMEALRPMLDKAGLWEFVGNLTRRVEESWLEAMTGQNKLIREGYERRVATMRSELLEAGDSPLERLLVDRVVMTWLQACQADAAYSHALNGDGHSLQQGTYHQARQDRANARHLKAIKALANVRRLLVPAVQVNIGRHQIINQGAPPDQHDEANP